jgi:glycosyltransferase involved in cell wall biosynthesis
LNAAAGSEMMEEKETPEKRASPSRPASGHDEFDEAVYLELHPDVAQGVVDGTYASGRVHWDLTGRAEGRLAAKPKDFNELLYLDLNPDVLQAVLTGGCPSGFYHWVYHGKAEGRAVNSLPVFPADWNEAQYLRLNSDVATTIRSGTFASGYEHWRSSGCFEGRPGAGAARAITSVRDALRAAPRGVNLFAFHGTAIGLGAAARGYADVFERIFPVNLVDIPWDLDTLRENLSGPPPYAFNFVQMNPDALPVFLRHYGPRVLPSRYNVGCWIWELHAGYASWHCMSRFFNHIWTASNYSAGAISTVSAAPVRVVPYVVDSLQASKVIRRADLDLAEGAFLFLYVFDVASTFARKNPLALVRAFRKAFGERTDVQLLLKYHHAGSDLPAVKLLERVASPAPNIRTINETLPEEQIYGLISSCDCFVSPHRSEGFGLNIAAAMYFGKPVIVTGYSGNMDFTSAENSFLIDYDLAPVQGDAGYYKTGYVWAEPCEEHLVHLLRTVVDSPEEARRRADLGRQTIQRQFNFAAVSATIREALNSDGLNLANPGVALA